MYNTDAVTHACYGGFDEMAQQYKSGNSPFMTSSFKEISKNTLYHFGEIYDDLEAFILFLVKTPFSPVMPVDQAGNILGHILFLILSDPVPVKQNVQSQ